MLELRQAGDSVKSLAETFKSKLKSELESLITISILIGSRFLRLSSYFLERRINEHQHSIQEKQKKLEKLKLLLKQLGTEHKCC